MVLGPLGGEDFAMMVFGSVASAKWSGKILVREAAGNFPLINAVPDRIVPQRLKEGGDQGHEPREIEYHEEKLEVTSNFSDQGAVSVVRFSDNLQN